VADIPELIPARILNEHVYCPRLAYLEWVDRKFEENSDTAEGSWIHRRVDVEHGVPPEPGERETDAPRTTSLTLASEKLGVIARIDLLEPRALAVVPVEYKRGRPRSAEDHLWEPEKVQLCAQVLLLREAGYVVDHAEVYFSESRTRHRLEIDAPLIERTLAAIAEVRANAGNEQAPPPLVDSPKCPRCSLVGPVPSGRSKCAARTRSGLFAPSDRRRVCSDAAVRRRSWEQTREATRPSGTA